MTSSPATGGALRTLIGYYESAIRCLAGVSMTIVVAIMAAQVFARYVLNDSLIWAEELCRYILIWQTFLFIGLAYKHGEMIAVDALPNLLPPLVKLALKAVVTAPILWFLWLMAVNGHAYAARFDAQTIPAVDFIWTALTGHGAGVSIFWVYISVTVGGTLLGLHVIGDLLADLLALRSSAAPIAEA